MTAPTPTTNRKAARALSRITVILLSVTWKWVEEHFAAFLNIVVLLVLAPFSLVTTGVTASLVIISLVFWYGIKQTNRAYKVCKTTSIALALFAFVYATLFPFFHKEQYYLVTDLSASPLASKIVHSRLSSGDAITTVILRDPIRPRLAKYICPLLSPKSRLLEIRHISGAQYVFLPLNGANEAIVTDKDGLSTNRSLHIPIVVSGIGLELDLSERRATGNVFSGSAALISFTVTDRPDLVPWQAVRLLSDSDEDTCFYAAILNEAIENLTSGRTREGAEMIEELSSASSRLGAPRPPSSLEQARLYALAVALSGKMFTGLASCHAIPLLVSAYSALLTVPKENAFDRRNLTLRWIVSEILSASREIKIANLKPLMNLENRPEVGSDQTWTAKTSNMAALPPKFLELMQSTITPEQAQTLKSITMDVEQDTTFSYFTACDKTWDQRSWSELYAIAKDARRGTSELMYLPDYLTDRLNREMADDEKEFSFKCDVIDTAVSVDPSGTSGKRAALAKQLAWYSWRIYLLQRKFPDVTDREVKELLSPGSLTSSSNVFTALLKMIVARNANDEAQILQFLDLTPPKASYWDAAYRDWLCSLFLSHISIVWPKTPTEEKYGAAFRKQLEDGTLDHFIRDNAGTGRLSLPSIVIIEWMYRAMGLQDKANELDRLCKDLTKRFTEGGLTAREIRRVASPQVTRIATSTSDRRATQKCVLLVGFSQLDFRSVINCISFAALSNEDVLNKDIQCIRDYADQQGFRQFRILNVTRGNFAEDCPSSVRIVAEEGQKRYLGSVSFSGASIPKPVLDSFLLNPGDPYCKKKIETVIERIKQYFLSEGFALTKATVVDAVNPNGVVAVRFAITPGLQITVHRLVIEGNRALDATALEQFKQKLPFKEGERLCRVPSDADLKDMTLFHFENGIALEGLDWEYRDTSVRTEKDVIVTIKQRLASEWNH